MAEQHFAATQNQIAHEHTASRDRTQLASVNNGRPGTLVIDSVNGRRFNQQQRIAQGIGNGQLSAGEAAKLEGREQNINRQVHADCANGGKLTPAERQQINKKQNVASREIYNDKHNDKREPM
jgi:hypothetical protein